MIKIIKHENERNILFCKHFSYFLLTKKSFLISDKFVNRITKTSFKNAQFLPSSQKLEQVIYELVETFKITRKHNSRPNDGKEIISLRSGDS